LPPGGLSIFASESLLNSLGPGTGRAH